MNLRDSNLNVSGRLVTTIPRVPTIATQKAFFSLESEGFLFVATKRNPSGVLQPAGLHHPVGVAAHKTHLIMICSLSAPTEM